MNFGAEADYGAASAMAHACVWTWLFWRGRAFPPNNARSQGDHRTTLMIKMASAANRAPPPWPTAEQCKCDHACRETLVLSPAIGAIPPAPARCL